MRIAFITESFPELSETFILGKVARLKRLGHEVTVFTQFKRSQAPHPDLLGELNLKKDVVRLPVWDRTRVKDVARAARAAGAGVFRAAELKRRSASGLAWVKALPFTRRPYDVIHAHYAYMGARYLEAMEVARVPMVVSLLGHDLTYGDDRARAGYPELFAQVPRFLASSHYLVGLAEQAGCPPAKLRVLYPEVDLDFFVHLDRRGRAAGPARLVTVGRLNWTKGLTYALAAMRRLLDAGVDYSYRIVGEGAARPELELLIQDLGLGERVVLAGAMDREETRRELSWADLFVLPSVTESFGLAAAEASATGLPVVATRVGGLPEAVEDGRAGLLVPSRDPEALAEAIKTLIDQPELRDQMGAAGRERVRQKFEAGSITAELVKHYEEVAAAWRRRD